MKQEIIKNKNRVLKLMFLAIAFLFANGCRVSEIREIKIDMHDANLEDTMCVSIIESVLKNKSQAGKDVEVTVLPAENAILVKYDAMLVGRKNLEDALAMNGFNAGEYKADESRRSTLPNNCFKKGDTVK